MSEFLVAAHHRENTPYGLLTRILGCSPRKNCTALVNAVDFIQTKLEQIAFSVIEHRYMLLCDHDYTAINYVADVLNITQEDARNHEINAIRRLQEPECLRFFIKNFGSREMLMGLLYERTSRAEELFDSVDNTHELLYEASEVELAHFLETVEIISRLHERYLARQRGK